MRVLFRELIPLIQKMKTFIIALFTLGSSHLSHAADKMKELKNVPNAYQTDINLVPIREGKEPAIQDSVSIGSIGSKFVTFHGRNLEVSFVQVGVDKDKNFVQIATKPTSHGSWSFVLIQGKPDGKPNNWCYFTVSYDPLDLDEKGSTETYLMMLGKRHSRLNLNDKTRSYSRSANKTER
jgi:hypothetical protein